MLPPANLHARSAGREILVLALLWAAATAFNLTKAVHIDDTAYLEIARAIRHDPLHAMRTELNWVHEREPIHAVNQPHLFIYFLTLSMCLFGDNEIAFHAVESAFTLLALIFFYLLARRLSGSARWALYLSALFVMGPALLPEQNVMCDVPMLACWLGFLWALLMQRAASDPVQGESDHRSWFYPLLAAGFVAAACLIKYTSLVLLPVLVLDLLWRGEWRRLWIAAVPIAALGAWSLFNYFDYGGIHLLGRESVARDSTALLRRLIAFFVCLGAVTPFAPLLLRRLPARGLPVLMLGLVAGAVLLLRTGTWNEKPVWWPCLRAAFLANGVVVYGGCLMLLIGELRTAGFRPGPGTHVAATMTAWLLGTAGFIILFAPFLAVRHILPLIPIALLLLAKPFPKPISTPARGDGHGLSAVVLALTVGLGVALATSDWLLADVYRRAPERLRNRLAQERADATIWFVGHWGWQWYAAHAGFRQYDPGVSEMREGDFLIIPEMVPRQAISPSEWQRCRRIDSVVFPSGPLTVLRTVTRVPPGGYYYLSDPRPLPWVPSTQPLEEFTLFRLGPPANDGPPIGKP